MEVDLPEVGGLYHPCNDPNGAIQQKGSVTSMANSSSEPQRFTSANKTHSAKK